MATSIIAALGIVPAAAAFAAVPPGSPRRAVDDPAVTSGLAWQLDATGTRTAWRRSLGAGTTVAVIDSRVEVDHPDLAGQVAGSVSCRGADGDPDRCRARPAGDETAGDAHGTHVAGLLAARADDGIGVAGVAPRARLLVVEALARECDRTACTPVGDTADVAAGVRWAVANGADIVNLSLTAGNRLGPELTDAVDEAWAAGAVTVLAAGNDGDLGGFADEPRALVVTATVRTGDRAPYAPDVDASPLGVAAPGGSEGDDASTCRVGAAPVGIVSTSALASGDGSGYACLAGTSMAVPQVSGGLALLRSMGFTRDQAVERLLGSARPGPGLGAGAIDLAGAVAPPYPDGVAPRPSTFATAAPPSPAVASSAGPFAPTSTPAPRRLPAWLLAVAGGLVAGTVADLAYRYHERRSTRPAATGGPGGTDGPIVGPGSWTVPGGPAPDDDRSGSEPDDSPGPATDPPARPGPDAAP